MGAIGVLFIFPVERESHVNRMILCGCFNSNHWVSNHRVQLGYQYYRW